MYNTDCEICEVYLSHAAIKKISGYKSPVCAQNEAQKLLAFLTINTGSSLYGSTSASRFYW